MEWRMGGQHFSAIVIIYGIIRIINMSVIIINMVALVWRFRWWPHTTAF